MATITQTRPASKIHPTAASTQSSWTIRDHAGRDHEVVVSSVESEQPSTSVFWREPSGLGEEITTVRSPSHDEAAAAAGRELDRLAGVPLTIGRGREVVWLRPTSQYGTTHVTLVDADGSDPALTQAEWRWLGGTMLTSLRITSLALGLQIRPLHGSGPYAAEVEHVLTWETTPEVAPRVLVSRAGYNTNGEQTYVVDALQPMTADEWTALARYLGGRL